ncbi:HtaA domain-containing protein [Streptomyces sp. NPDC059828]|uniref:HtaA domain-containing protein n=1 Tax=Streptomyces sp. NPDC059828 TaxID=3346965 RepID=UPI0036559B4A
MPASAPRRPIALISAIAVAAALGATAIALPASAAEKAPGAPTLELKDGTLDWGFKESFRKYLASPVAHGTITTGEGAKQAPDNGVFSFVDGKGTYDTGTHATANAFRGSVHFTAHGGVLDITMSDLKLSTTGSATPTGEITADVVTKKQDGSFDTKNDLVIAALDMSGVRPGQGTGGAMVFKDIPAKLTAGGAAAFSGFYQEGTQLDPATLTVKAASGGGTPPKPTPTAIPTPTATATATSKPTAKPTTKPSPAKVQGGKLSWGVKKSWRGYVDDICGGTITANGGAAKNGALYDFRYGKARLDTTARSVDASFVGTVRFACAGHGIDWTISDVKVKATGKSGTLIADVTTAKGTANDVAFARLDLGKADFRAKSGVVTLKNLPAALTKAGAAQFAGPGGEVFYRPGTAIDPVTVALTLDKDATLPAASGGTPTTDTSGTGTGTDTAGGTVGGGLTTTGHLAATGSEVPSSTLLAASGALAAAGAGVVLAVRRRAGVSD